MELGSGAEWQSGLGVTTRGSVARCRRRLPPEGQLHCKQPSLPSCSALQDIVGQWSDLPPARQQLLFEAALLQAAQGDWSGLEQALRLGMELELEL